MAKAAVSRISLQGTYADNIPVHDPLEANLLLFENEEGMSSLISMDYCFISIEKSLQIRNFLSEHSGIPAERIVTHCTHSHTAPFNHEITGEYLGKLKESLLIALHETQNNLLEAKVAFVEVDTGRDFNINRRKHISDEIGSLTLFMGLEQHEGWCDGGKLNRARLTHWSGGGELDSEFQEPQLYDGETDGWLQALLLRDIDDQPIGSLVRYSAHIAAAGHTSKRKYSSDFPGVIRERVRKSFGGECVFVNGPCGNLLTKEIGEWTDYKPETCSPEQLQLGVPWVTQKDPEACWREVDRIGNELSDILEKKILEVQAYEPLEMSFLSDHVLVPTREDMYRDDEVAKSEALSCRNELNALSEQFSWKSMKGIADRVNYLEVQSWMKKWYDFDDDFYEKHELNIPLSIWKCNDVILMGFPGESFWQTPGLAKKHALEVGARFMSFTEANGDVGYIPTEAERAGGDYETTTCVMAPGAEEMIENHAKDLVEKLFSSKN